MIVTYLSDLDDTDRDVRAETWRSRRFVLAKEGVGFSFHDTVLSAGTRDVDVVRPPHRGRLLRRRRG